MSAFYNENDAFPAQWLRNLAAAGHIAPGVVDERSIVDLKPEERVDAALAPQSLEPLRALLERAVEEAWDTPGDDVSHEGRAALVARLLNERSEATPEGEKGATE